MTFIILSTLSAAAFSDETIVMLRHGEKPALGLGQLSCMGFNRSLSLPGVLFSRFGQPTVIYAPNPGVTKNDHHQNYNYIRPLATIEPTAIAAGLPVNTAWGFNDISHFNTELLNEKNKDGVIFITWEHKMIEKISMGLVSELGGSPADIPSWGAEDYDSLYVITIGHWINGKREVSFHTEAQGLNNSAAECGINEEITEDHPNHKKENDKLVNFSI